MTRYARSRLLLFTLLSAPGGALFSDPAIAMEETVPTDGEIVVTAQKRSERLVDVPMSVTAATGEQLDRLGITDSSQLDRLVPGFTFQKSNYGNPVFAIRGVGFFDTALAISPAVTVYTDQVPLPYAVMARGAVLDLERVEALKGPQGTLFGQNSTGGAINYIAAKPTSDLSAGLSLTYGRFDQADAEAFVSGPLSPTLKARLALRTEQRGDWQESYTRDDSLGKKRFYNGRLLLDWEPSDTIRIGINLNGWIDRSDSQAAQFWQFAPTVPIPELPPFAVLPTYPVAPRNARAADWDAGKDFAADSRFGQAAVRVDWELGDAATLTSITAYDYLRNKGRVDVDGTSYSTLIVNHDGKVELFGQELRLAGRAGGLRWMVGGNYQHERADENLHSQDVNTTNSFTPAGTFSSSDAINNQTIETWAIFGGLDYDLTDRLTVQASARYTRQQRDFYGCAADSGDNEFATVFNALFGLGVGPGECVTMADNVSFAKLGAITDSLDEDNLSWRAGINWKPDGDSLVYANVTRGYKAGGFPTLPGIFKPQLQPVRQESLVAYEAGFKASLADRAVQLSGALFYYDYRNKQIQGYLPIPPFGNLPAIINVPKSTVRGAEIEATLRPVENLRISGGVTYVHSRVKADPAPPLNAYDAYGNVTSFVGEAFPNTPRWQFAADAEYSFPLAGDWSGFVGGNMAARTRSQAVLGETPGFEIGGYALIDLRAGLENDRWRITLWGRNVTNRYYRTNVAYVVDTSIYYAGMPATYGVTAAVRFR